MKPHLLLTALVLSACSQGDQSIVDHSRISEIKSPMSLGVSTVYLDQQFSGYTASSLTGHPLMCGWHFPIAQGDATSRSGAVNVISVDTDDEFPTLLSTVTLNEDPQSNLAENILIEINTNSVEGLGLSLPKVIGDSIELVVTNDISLDQSYDVICHNVDTVCQIFSK